MLDLLMGLFGKVKAIDNSKVDSVVAGTKISVDATDPLNPIIANTYSHPTGDGSSHVPATGTGNDGNVLTAGTTADSATWQPSNRSSFDSYYYDGY